MMMPAPGFHRIVAATIPDWQYKKE